MNGKEKKKIHISKQAINVIVSGFVLFLCAFAFTPSAGVLRTIPFFLLGGAVCSVLSVDAGLVAAMSAIMTLCMYFATGRNVGEALVFAVVSCLVSVSGVYAVGFVNSARKTTKKSVRKKCVTATVFAVVIPVVLSAVLCGNVVSFVISDGSNTERVEYMNEKLADARAEKKFTSYDTLSGEYRTYVQFRHNGGLTGADDDCYISKKNGVLTDCVRDYYKDGLLSTAAGRIAGAVSGATWGYNIAAIDMALEDGEILTPSSSLDDYMDRVSCVVSFESLFYEDDRDDFASICRDTVTAIKSSGIEFDKIVLCGGNAGEVVFSMTLTEDTKTEDVYKAVEEFDEKHISDVGTSEQAILDYWQNK